MAIAQSIPRLLLALLIGIFLASCTIQQPGQIEQQQPADFPLAIYRAEAPYQAEAPYKAEAPNQAAARPKQLYQVDSSTSEIRIKVSRGGLMAALGHDHIVASRDTQGFILLDELHSNCRADFYAPLNRLIVDEPTMRANANLKTSPTARDIEGTKNNMLLSLDAANFPFVQLGSSDCADALKSEPIEVTINLHGISRKQRIHVEIERQPRALTLVGHFSLLQSDFGIEPFSLFNGLLKVEDKLEIEFQLKAKRL